MSNSSSAASRWSVKLLLVWLAACPVLLGQSGPIITIAGSGTGYANGGFSGDTGPATSARLNWPSGLAVDSGGNLFIADFQNNRIRKVAPNGTITTVAGSGATGHTNGSFSGDGGLATSATLAGPVDVAVDAAGNLYIADTYNSRIRKVSPSGIITTVAGNGNLSFSGDGGKATSASLFYPEGVAVDASGNLFIADNYNQRIRKVSASGVISTVAGSGAQGFSGDGGPATSAAFYFPTDIVVDNSGNLIIVDAFNNRVRKVSPNGIITTVAGNSGTPAYCGQASCSGDGGPAGSATLDGPLAVAVDASGNLFIADNGNSRVRKVSTGGIITTVAGDGILGFSGDGGPATSASLDYPDGIALDAAGDLFIAEEGNERVREVLGQSPGLTTLPSVVNLSVVAGGQSTQQIAIGSALAGLAWAAQTSSSWMTLSPASGTVPGTLSLVADTTSLQPGSYTGTITIQSAQASPPQTTVTVNLTVIAAGATLSVSAASLSFQAPQAGPAESQSLQIGGTMGVAWQATVATSSGGSWLNVAPSSGNVPSSVTVLADPTGLAPGIYQGNINIQAPGAAPSSIKVGVTLTVTPPAMQFVQQTKLVGNGAVNNPIGAFEGYSVALSADGNTALIGGWEDADFSGAAWVFSRSGGSWTQQGAKLAAGASVQTRAGWSVALSGDGNTAAVGMPGIGGLIFNAGGAVVYTRNAGVWSQQGNVLTGSGAIAESGDIPALAFQGTAVALSADGNTLLIGGPNDNNSAGAVWVFTRSSGNWTQQAKLVGTGAAGAASQGSSVALSGDGNTAVLGGPTDNSGVGAAWIFTRSGNAWTQQGGKLVGTGAGGSEQGSSVAISSDGSTVLLGGPSDGGGFGATWVFVRSGGVWAQQGAKLVGSGAIGEPGQGDSVALSSDGNTAIVGGAGNDPSTAPYTGSMGATWIFTRSGNSWTQAGNPLVGSGADGAPSQGLDVALSGDGRTAIIGGPHDGGEFGSGAAWVFAASQGATSAPVLFGLNPTSAAEGGAAFTLTVNGSGFASGASIVWNGSVLTANYVSSVELTASISANLIASPGSVNITVFNPGSAVSNSFGFTIGPPPPAISGLSPTAVTAGRAAFTLMVNGSGFTNASTVQWNGAAVATSYLSATQLTAAISTALIASAATINITVVDKANGTSGAVIFSVSTAPGAANGQLISHVADGGGWRSILLLANTSAAAAPYTVSFWNDSGSTYLPSLASGVPTGTIPVGGSAILQTGDTASALAEGWAQVTSSQSIGGTAIFRYDPWSQEAAVPLLVTGGTKLEIPYQAGHGLSLGVALSNTSATQTANVTEIIRDQTGNQLSTRTLTLAPLNHTAFNPTIPAAIVGGGVAEYDSNVSLFGLGIRSAPQGSGLAFTSVDAVLPQAASTKTISHVADGGGWRSTIILVNTDTAPAQYTVSFRSDSGVTYQPPLAAGAATGTIPVGGSTIIETADSGSALTQGWAQVTSSQSVGGTAIFRYDPWSQEAAVPLLAGGGTQLEIPYQSGNGLSLGIALANPNVIQTANITEVIRDANGKQLSSRTFTLSPLNHTAFNPTFPANTTGGGVVEYDSDTTIYGLGIRGAPQSGALAFTSVRAVYK